MMVILWTWLFWAWVAAEALIAVTTRTGKHGGKVQDRGSQLILWVVICAAVTACEVVRHLVPANMFGGAAWLRPMSLIVLVMALTIRWTAVFTLGQAFSANVAIRESQRILRSGLYGVVRHPSYLGLLLVFVAIGIHSRNWISFALAVLPTTAALFYRIHVEEQALREAFGDEYAQYSRVTKRLVPGVW